MKNAQQIEEHLNTARNTLAAILRVGGDTAAEHDLIASLEADLAHAEQSEADASTAQANEEARAVADDAMHIADEAAAAINARVTVPGLQELTSEPLPAVQPSHAIRAASARLAQVRAELRRADQVYLPLKQDADSLADRLAAKRRSVDAIKARRAAGSESKTDAAELQLLMADLEVLEPISAEAHRIAREAMPDRSALAVATGELTRAEAQSTFEATRAVLVQAEAVFMNAWFSMLTAGKAAGLTSPWSSWQATPDMRRAVTGQLVPGHQHRF